jgi:mRNA interferase RelE/StbE
VYELYLERAAERDLKRLSAEDFGRIVKHLKALADDPRPPGCRKISGSKNDWRVRVGSYRILYEINKGAKTVKVMRVIHRREAYR